MSTFDIAANATPMGEYKGTDENDAVENYAMDAGYESFADLLARVPGSSRDELDIEEIDTDKLVKAVENAAGVAVFQDSYGEGVAVVGDNNYATYRELAEAFDLDLSDFYC